MIEDSEPQYCSCEAVARGKLGVVLPEEVVSRILFNPQHIRRDGTVKSGLFSPTDIREKGVSLVRSQHLKPAELKELADALAKRYHKPRSAEGVIECKAEEVRKIVDAEGVRLICLLDDPVVGAIGVPDNPAHAIAVAARKISDEDIAEIKTLLTEAFGALRRFSA